MTDLLDLKDKKLIALLFMNSRMRLHEISKIVKLSKNSVKYRIERLQKLGYIKNFIPIINYSALGYYTFDILIKFKAKKEDESHILDYISKHNNVIWASTLFGDWDVFIQFISKDFMQFYEMQLQPFLQKFNDYIDDYEIKIATGRLKFDQQIHEFSKLVKSEKIEFQKVNDYLGNFSLSIIDLDLLFYLSKNARASFLEIGMNIGQSLETARNHFNNLIDKGIIIGFTIDFDYVKIGYINYLAFFKFRNISIKNENEFKKYITQLSQVQLALKNGNLPEIYMLLMAKSSYEAETLIKDIKEKFYGEIQKVTSILITKDIKIDMFPQGLKIKL